VTIRKSKKIAAAKEKNAVIVQVLFKTQNDYPAEGSALICCLRIRNTDFCILQAAHESKKKVVVNMGPFAAFNDRKITIAIQKYIVQWSIAMFCNSFPKLQTLKTYREMMIAVIDAEQLLPCHPDCAKEARAYQVAFADLLMKIKHAAGMYCVVMRTYFSCSYGFACSDSVSQADRAVGRHRIEMRDALIKLSEEPIPESNKAGQKVMEAVMGRPLTNKPVLCFLSTALGTQLDKNS
jgi:hypothetical protein